MKECAKRLILAALCFGLSGWLWSQTPYGEIVFADGREFSVVRDGTVETFRANDAESIGYRLKAGDLIQTGNSTFLEISLQPRGSIIKVAENSSFVIKGFGTDGENVSLNMMYGRVRAKVAKLTGTDRFQIRSDSTVAGVRGTDFGFDVIIRPPEKPTAPVRSPLVQVYCFEGEVEVTPIAPAESEAALAENGPAAVEMSSGAASGTEIAGSVGTEGGTVAVAAPAFAVPQGTSSYIIKADQLVAIDVSMPVPTVERRVVDSEVKTYWQANDYQTAPSQPKIFEVTASPRVSDKPVETKIEYVYIQKETSSFSRALTAKNGAIAAGIMFGIMGLGMQATGLISMVRGDDSAGAKFVYGGSIGIGISLLTFSLALAIQTPTQ